MKLSQIIFGLVTYFIVNKYKKIFQKYFVWFTSRCYEIKYDYAILF